MTEPGKLFIPGVMVLWPSLFVPAKDTDARFEGYRDEFGDSSWELDALDPDVISNLIQDELDTVIDFPAWEETTAQEAENKRALTATYLHWPAVSSFALDRMDLAAEDDQPEEDEDDDA